MVLSGNSTQSNCSRSNSVVALSGKEQISPVLLLSDSAPDNHNEIEQTCVASVIRTSLRTRRKTTSSDKECDSTSNGKSPSTGFVNGKIQADDTTYQSLLSFLPTSPSPLGSNNYKTNMSSTWTCTNCQLVFLSNAHLQKHVETHHTKSSTPQIQNGKSPVISNSTSKRQSSEEHNVASKRMRRSPSVERCFIFKSEMMLHTSSSNGNYYKCDICAVVFELNNEKAFKIHYIKNHINDQFVSVSDRALCFNGSSGLRSELPHIYQCYLCNTSYSDKQLLIKHNDEHRKNVFECENCHAVFYQSKAFLNHIRNCSKPINNTCGFIICLFCKDVTMVKDKEEDRSLHTKKFHCHPNLFFKSECVFGCAFKNKKVLKLYEHYCTVHKDAYFSCTVCKRRYASQLDLTTHFSAVHPDKMNVIQLSPLPQFATNSISISNTSLNIISKSQISSLVTQSSKPTQSNGPSKSITVLQANGRLKSQINPSLLAPSIQQNFEPRLILPSNLTIELVSKPKISPNSCSPSRTQVNGNVKLKHSVTPPLPPVSSVKPTKPSVESKEKLNPVTVQKSSSPCKLGGLTAQQQYFQKFFLKNIMKIDIVEQVSVLAKNAQQYPDLFKLPDHEIFRNRSSPKIPQVDFLEEEDFVRPVFSSSQDNNVYICKTCGVEDNHLDKMKDHMSKIHPLIKNDYFVFHKDEVPPNFWKSYYSGIHSTKVIKTSLTPKNMVRKCTACTFSSKSTIEFHKHLLLCAKKQQKILETNTKSTKSQVKKVESNHIQDTSRRRMAITGVIRVVPDDPLFSYKQKLEKTINKPGDSETVFNMLNKLPSKRLVKTTERYDALHFHNPKSMKPKSRNSAERSTVNIKDSYVLIDEYLSDFIYSGPKLTQVTPNKSNDVTSDIKAKSKIIKSNSVDDASKVLLDKKIKTAKSSVDKINLEKKITHNSKDQLDKINSNKLKLTKFINNIAEGDCKLKKFKATKVALSSPVEAQTKISIDKKIKPKLNNSINENNKMCIDKKAKVTKLTNNNHSVEPNKVNNTNTDKKIKINNKLNHTMTQEEATMLGLDKKMKCTKTNSDELSKDSKNNKPNSTIEETNKQVKKKLVHKTIKGRIIKAAKRKNYLKSNNVVRQKKLIPNNKVKVDKTEDKKVKNKSNGSDLKVDNKLKEEVKLQMKKVEEREKIKEKASKVDPEIMMPLSIITNDDTVDLNGVIINNTSNSTSPKALKLKNQLKKLVIDMNDRKSKSPELKNEDNNNDENSVKKVTKTNKNILVEQNNKPVDNKSKAVMVANYKKKYIQKKNGKKLIKKKKMMTKIKNNKLGKNKKVMKRTKFNNCDSKTNTTDILKKKKL